MKTKRIICFWGGPGTGKSTTSAEVFAKLKKLNYDCEMNREYVKDWVWEKRAIKPGDQTYLFAKQARKERQYMENKLDFIVSDSPMALSILYGRIYDKYEQEHNACLAMLKQHHSFCVDHGYKTEHIFLKRKKIYNPNGRHQSEDEAKAIDTQCVNLLKELKINYVEFDCDENVSEHIINYLKSLE
jgi:nicotinamide riboside kinase